MAAVVRQVEIRRIISLTCGMRIALRVFVQKAPVVAAAVELVPV